MVTMWEAIKQFFFCRHEWTWWKNVDDRNLRTGHRHQSSVYVCVKCARYKTLEHE